MITNANALQSALAHLLTEPVGHRISMDANLRRNVASLPAWCIDHGLEYEIVDGKLTLWKK
jgi:hypothetical protein